MAHGTVCNALISGHLARSRTPFLSAARPFTLGNCTKTGDQPGQGHFSVDVTRYNGLCLQLLVLHKLCTLMLLHASSHNVILCRHGAISIEEASRLTSPNYWHSGELTGTRALLMNLY